jgi:hypothetical protein
VSQERAKVDSFGEKRPSAYRGQGVKCGGISGEAFSKEAIGGGLGVGDLTLLGGWPGNY